MDNFELKLANYWFKKIMKKNNEIKEAVWNGLKLALN